MDTKKLEAEYAVKKIRDRCDGKTRRGLPWYAFGYKLYADTISSGASDLSADTKQMFSVLYAAPPNGAVEDSVPLGIIGGCESEEFKALFQKAADMGGDDYIWLKDLADGAGTGIASANLARMMTSMANKTIGIEGQGMFISQMMEAIRSDYKEPAIKLLEKIRADYLGGGFKTAADVPVLSGPSFQVASLSAGVLPTNIKALLAQDLPEETRLSTNGAAWVAGSQHKELVVHHIDPDLCRMLGSGLIMVTGVKLDQRIESQLPTPVLVDILNSVPLWAYNACPDVCAEIIRMGMDGAYANSGAGALSKYGMSSRILKAIRLSAARHVDLGENKWQTPHDMGWHVIYVTSPLQPADMADAAFIGCLKADGYLDDEGEVSVMNIYCEAINDTPRQVILTRAEDIANAWSVCTGNWDGEDCDLLELDFRTKLEHITAGEKSAVSGTSA